MAKMIIDPKNILPGVLRKILRDMISYVNMVQEIWSYGEKDHILIENKLKLPEKLCK